MNNIGKAKLLHELFPYEIPQLLDDYTVLFVNDRIVKYAEGKNENSKFKQAVALFYNS